MSTLCQPSSLCASHSVHTHPSDVSLQLVFKEDRLKRDFLRCKRCLNEENGRKISNEEILLNKRLLLSHSLFFSAMFTNGMKETAQNKVELSMKKEDRPVFRIILNFIEQLECRDKFETDLGLSSSKDFFHILDVANQYQFSAVIDLLSEKIFPLSNIKDVNRFLEYVASHEEEDPMENHQQRCLSLLLSKFGKLDSSWNTKEFFKLNVLSLELLLSSDRLQLYSENTVFQAICKWISIEKKRKKYWIRLADRIRFHHMTPDYLQYLARYPKSFAKEEWLQEKIRNATSYQVSPMEKVEDPLWKKPRALNTDKFMLEFSPHLYAMGITMEKFNYFGYQGEVAYNFDAQANFLEFKLQFHGTKYSRIEAKFRTTLRAWDFQASKYCDLKQIDLIRFPGAAIHLPAKDFGRQFQDKAGWWKANIQFEIEYVPS